MEEEKEERKENNEEKKKIELKNKLKKLKGSIKPQSNKKLVWFS
jgi:hypothetical protein